MSLQPKSTLPTHLTVLVCDIRENGMMWPLLRIEKRQDGFVKFESGRQNAPLGLSVLKEAFELCLTQTAKIAQKKEGGQD